MDEESPKSRTKSSRLIRMFGAAVVLITIAVVASGKYGGAREIPQRVAQELGAYIGSLLPKMAPNSVPPVP